MLSNLTLPPHCAVVGHCCLLLEVAAYFPMHADVRNFLKRSRIERGKGGDFSLSTTVYATAAILEIAA